MSDIDFSKIYSFSKLNLFDKCKQQYYFNYLDPEIAPRKKEFIKPRDFKTKGSAVHDAITLFYHLPVEKRTFKNLRDCLLEAWYSEDDLSKTPPLGEIGGFTSLAHERKCYKDSLVLLKNFFEFKDINPSWFKLPTKNIKYSFSDYKDMIKPIDDIYSISGKFDRIDKLENNNLRIIDFKTGKAKKDNFQLEFYKLLAEMNFDKKVDLVTFYYFKDKKIENYNFSNITKDEIKNKVLEKIKEIVNTKEFSPNPNFLCNYCDFQEVCPDWKNKHK
ncbi:MAG: PD-(D/E)XK nuclease family protein [Candidatus Nealsonbacteria bacterium]